MSPEFIANARRYCELIESRATSQGLWLVRISELLPRLHASISALLVQCREATLTVLPEPVDLDARFELFSQLRASLADRDAYWLEFDTFGEGMAAMTGSLADDLTDIYCELKQGFQIFESDPGQAAAIWAFGYEQHWGQHLVDAERHLAMLEAQSRLRLSV
ncbi:DUF5063 domain-containing protein [Caldichromatium japonicum]|uniref:DUF5063 domain-containing protein n=1 Tax=Caldichromatium japonicum TaxID=2699430 RepID=A0A6G7VHG9_9GAMM|nr:DUF5063 domain-containing protein [Caldichromatium japonicum]